ncbi:MAG: Rrf2 family transcriptional regulator [Clostridiales bacterium]|nr:Rrf2 family transcriptional regulator [Clostridiales bacterium]
MRLSTKSRYALEGLLYLAVYGGAGPLSVKEIASGIQVSPAYMEQIFVQLKRSGLIGTQRGSGGGFFLSRPEDTITVGKVIEILEGSTVPVRCVENRSSCSGRVRHCISRRVWVRVSDAIAETANALTLKAIKDQFIAETGGAGK